MRWVKVRVPVIVQSAEEPVVLTADEPINEYAETLRLTSSTATLQTLRWRSGFTGTLTGITVFNDAIDAGDYWYLTLRGAKIREKAYPVAKTAINESYSKPIYAGDSLVLYYASQGTTVKNIDFTPRVRYHGEGLSERR